VSHSVRTLDFQVLFESAPGLFLALSSDLTIIAVSDAYLRATMTRRNEILGRGIFEVFPDNPGDPAATGVRNLKMSLARALETKIPDTMAVQKYDIRKPESEGAGFEERYWSPINTPILDEHNEIRYIIHRVEDVTDYIRAKHEQIAQDRMTQELRTRTEEVEKEVYLRAREVQEANRRFETANADLAKVNKELETFCYSVSHDLRAPLRGIDGFSQALLEDCAAQLDGQGKACR
jgi:signal transduction histidine kinase